MTGCTCPNPGWCERHKVHKTAHWHHLCQTREGHFQAWEEGRGPGQLKSPGATARTGKRLKDGWGDRVSAMLAKIGITEDRYKEIKQKFGLPPTCNCPRRKEWLNRVGRWWNGEEE